jgi:hypothetical protein
VSDDTETTRPLREHARMLGGRLAVHRLPSGGQRITLGLPLARGGAGSSHAEPYHPE